MLVLRRRSLILAAILSTAAAPAALAQSCAGLDAGASGNMLVNPGNGGVTCIFV